MMSELEGLSVPHPSKSVSSMYTTVFLYTTKYSMRKDVQPKPNVHLMAPTPAATAMLPLLVSRDGSFFETEFMSVFVKLAML